LDIIEKSKTKRKRKHLQKTKTKKHPTSSSVLRCGYHFTENSLNVPKKDKRVKKKTVKHNDQHMYDMKMAR